MSVEQKKNNNGYGVKFGILLIGKANFTVRFYKFSRELPELSDTFYDPITVIIMKQCKSLKARRQPQ